MKQYHHKFLTAAILAVSLSSAGMSGNAQAHGDVDLSVPAQLLLLNAFLDPYRDHDHGYSYLKPRRIASHHRHGNHHRHGGRHHERQKHHKRHDDFRPRSHSRGNYRDDHRGKGRHRD